MSVHVCVRVCVRASAPHNRAGVPMGNAVTPDLSVSIPDKLLLSATNVQLASSGCSSLFGLASDAQQLFYHADRGKLGVGQLKSHLKRMTKWLAEVWEG